MFNNIIEDTALTVAEAENYFKRYICCMGNRSPNGDKTFISTLRALVMPRIDNPEECCPIVLKFSRTSAFLDRLRVENENDDVGAVSSLMKNSDVIINSKSSINYSSMIEIFQIDCVSNDTKGIFELIENNFTSAFPDWEAVPKVTLFYMKTKPVLCYVNEKIHSTILITGLLSMKMYHYLQCSITAFLPWFFPKDKPVTDKEKRLIKSLTEDTPDTYLACLQEFAEDYDFRKMFVHDSLAGIELKFASEICKQLEQEINVQDNKILAAQNELNLFIQNRAKKSLQLAGMQMMLKESDPEASEIMNYFLSNRDIRLIGVDGNAIYFAFKGYLEYYDEEQAKIFIDNERSYFYNFDNYILDEQDFKQVLSAIFLTKELKVRMCAAFVVHIPGMLEGIKNFEFDSEFEGYMPNPHIQNYNCMGDMSAEINKLIERSDYITAFQECDISARSITFTDSVVMGGFARQLNHQANSHRSCIELPDGTVVNVVGAYEWLKANKTEV